MVGENVDGLPDPIALDRCSGNVLQMSRHSIRQAKRDDLAFPVRVKVRVPADGLGELLDRMLVWLRNNNGSLHFACHNQPGIACSTAAFYFRDVRSALDFIDAFPQAELADGVASPAYRSAQRLN
ncbi:hypothetical protein [Erythrobacter sp.]|uniref:hypothetical protein n=1 Tax=Erythrobacter sp. TaxID=1042 RepID=UPI003C72061E